MQKFKLALLSLIVVTFCAGNARAQLPLTFDALFDVAGVVENVGPNNSWSTSTSAPGFWVNTLAAQAFFSNGNSVVFGRDGAGNGSQSINVDSSVTNVGNMTIANVAGGLNFTFTGQRISGTSSTLLIDGTAASTTTFNNSTGGANEFQNFTLNRGVVAGSASISVANAITFESGIVSIALTGAGTLTKSTSGNVSLSGTNSYTGGTFVNAGNLVLGNATNTLLDNGAVTVNGGTLALGFNSDTVGDVTLVSGSITGLGGMLTGSSYGVQSGSISAILGGSAALLKQGSGTVTLSGANVYTGGTTISNGTLQLSGSGTTGSTSGALNVNGTGSLDLGGQSRTVGAISLAGSGSITNGMLTGTTLTSTGGSISAVIAGATSFSNTSGTTTLSGANTYTGGTTISGGTVQLSGSGTTGATSGSLTMSNNAVLDLGGLSRTVGSLQLSGTASIINGNLSFSSVISTGGSISTGLSGTGSFTQSSGTTTLTGVNTYSGGTAVNGGTLIASSIGTGNVSIAEGATLQIPTLSIGAGQLLSGAGNIDGNLSFDGTNGATLVLDPTLTTTLDLSKILNVTGTMTFHNFTLSNLSGINWSSMDSGVYTLISGGVTTSFTGTSSTFSNQFALGGGKFGYFQAGSLDLVITAVPEPSSLMLLSLAALVGAGFRRRVR